MRISDWSSDVCSSDLNIALAAPALPALPKQYRVTHVEPDGERVAISAVEIDTGKWAASDAGEAEEGYVPPIDPVVPLVLDAAVSRSEEHTSELQSLMRISYAVFCVKKKIVLVHDSHDFCVCRIITMWNRKH